MKKATPKSSPITYNHYCNTADQSINDVLASIPASLPHDEWVKTAMALKSAGVAFEVFDAWSSTASSYNSRDARLTWRSVEPTGGITIASLFHIAKQYGYDPNQSGADFRLLIEQTKQKQQKALRKCQKDTKKAKWKANQILDSCDYSEPNHPYFFSKHIAPPLPVWQLRQSLVIPVMDLLGEVHSLQFIQPNGKKTFLKNGAIKGHFYQIWSRKRPTDAIVICEGYATAITLACHYTPDCTVVVAFNAGNLKPVARVLRAAFPDVHIVIAGDNDKSGTGQKAAFEAAKAVSGDVALPVFQDEKAGSDWNDRWQVDMGSEHE